MRVAGIFAGILVLLGACGGGSAEAPKDAKVADEASLDDGARAVAGAGAIEDETAFRARCREEILRAVPNAQSWVDDQCGERWERAGNAAAMAEALLALAPADGDDPLSAAEARGRLSGVRWASGGEGRLGDLSVSLTDRGGIAFAWQARGAEGRYNVIEALRIRGVTLQGLGCPQYPGASMGTEKVMTATAPGRRPFTLTVYARPAPTGFEPGIYQVEAGYRGAPPNMAALRVGRYPGGGGRAFAVDPTGWVADCPDPE